ncbi:metabolite traffic protein EboE [Dyadobacter tibetensis]|uniref:metabolite traffic protein EboE n=1 Tax=Dyadobacter tibetensis TaxID=1211851 RepID=UPI0004722230|nr:metabolite traffic protein EboE [Dyadobacter tibetensis]
MKTPYGHLTYCSNIHPGERWEEHFASLKESLPLIKEQRSPTQSFGLGLRLANEASLALSESKNLAEFKAWLEAEDIYVFVINGFPYGGFHDTVVKDQVHTPDWTTDERQAYTFRLFHILSQLLPEGMDGGVSTPPLSYRLWWESDTQRLFATEKATAHMLQVLDELIGIKEKTGRNLHLDIEPEPDGILDNIADFIDWYTKSLLPTGISYLKKKYSLEEEQAKSIILNHIRLCYDICHAAVAYEHPKEILSDLQKYGIQVGRIQISSALKVDFSENTEAKLQAISTFNEPIYLHQVVARTAAEELEHYPDLPQALAAHHDNQREWRVHFHVPLFISSYGLLESTQQEIIDTLALHQKQPFTQFLEVETYTWGVLPADLQKPIAESISRELAWVETTLASLSNPKE